MQKSKIKRQIVIFLEFLVVFSVSFFVGNPVFDFVQFATFICQSAIRITCIVLLNNYKKEKDVLLFRKVLTLRIRFKIITPKKDALLF